MDRGEGKRERKWAIGEGRGERVIESLREGGLDLCFLGEVWNFTLTHISMIAPLDLLTIGRYNLATEN